MKEAARSWFPGPPGSVCSAPPVSSETALAKLEGEEDSFSFWEAESRISFTVGNPVDWDEIQADNPPLQYTSIL